jgi:Mg2+ and Co2+ transporter CorA
MQAMGSAQERRVLARVMSGSKRLAAMRVQIEDAEDALADLEAKVTNSQPPKMREGDPYRETLNGMGPFRGYCSHPMTEAWKANCPIAHERHKQDEITEAVKGIAAEAQPQVARITAMKSDLARLQQVGRPKKEAMDKAMSALAAARDRHRKELEKLKAPGREAAKIEALLASYRNACAALAQWDKDLVSLKKAKEDLDSDLEKLVKHHQKLVDRFSRIFDHIAKRMLGEAVTGRVRIKGKALVPELEYHDPVCSSHTPGQGSVEQLSGSACHGCLYISETSGTLLTMHPRPCSNPAFPCPP